MLPNDLLFVIHGTCAAVFAGIQALVYERKEQSLSLFGQGMCGMYGLSFFASLFLVTAHAIHLLDFLYVCSFIKLVVTVTKYVPQVSGPRKNRLRSKTKRKLQTKAVFRPVRNSEFATQLCIFSSKESLSVV